LRVSRRITQALDRSIGFVDRGGLGIEPRVVLVEGGRAFAGDLIVARQQLIGAVAQGLVQALAPVNHQIKLVDQRHCLPSINNRLGDLARQGDPISGALDLVLGQPDLSASSGEDGDGAFPSGAFTAPAMVARWPSI
jgi:hypothetical protein